MNRHDTVGRITSAIVVASLLLVAAGASAHAFLQRADPREGSTVRAAPREVTLYFTERLEPAYSSARVIDEGGQPVDRGTSRVEPANPSVLRVSVLPLPPGAYKVIWRVLSVDSHITEGDFTFRVRAR